MPTFILGPSYNAILLYHHCQACLIVTPRASGFPCEKWHQYPCPLGEGHMAKNRLEGWGEARGRVPLSYLSRVQQPQKNNLGSVSVNNTFILTAQPLCNRPFLSPCPAQNPTHHLSSNLLAASCCSIHGGFWGKLRVGESKHKSLLIFFARVFLAGATPLCVFRSYCTAVLSMVPGCWPDS